MSNVKRLWRDATAVLLTVIMVCCSVMNGPCRTHAVDEKPSDVDLKKRSEEIVRLVNEAREEENKRIDAENVERAKNGEELLPRLQPLKEHYYLDDKARERAREIIFDFAHYRPGKRTFKLHNPFNKQVENIENMLKERNINVQWNEDKTEFTSWIVDDIIIDEIRSILDNYNCPDYEFVTGRFVFDEELDAALIEKLDQSFAENEIAVVWGDDLDYVEACENNDETIGRINEILEECGCPEHTYVDGIFEFNEDVTEYQFAKLNRQFQVKNLSVVWSDDDRVITPVDADEDAVNTINAVIRNVNKIDFVNLQNTAKFIFNDELTAEQLEKTKNMLSEKNITVKWAANNKSFTSSKKDALTLSFIRQILKDEINYEMGDSFATIIDTNLIPLTCAGENLAAGFGTAEQTFEQWKNSPNHWRAILSPEYTHIGVGCAYEQNSTYGYYWTQLFVAMDDNGQDTNNNTNIGDDKNDPDDKTNPPDDKKQVSDVVPKGSGDINGDGEINSFDLITLRKYVTGQIELNDLQRESADLLKDGSITAADITVLQRYINGVYRSLPVKMDQLPPLN
ncbi:CAP domain-containing protein [Ruminococcus flavefaciens]|uniref:CAP domain-containing protein n=1 Tax=Ruminococcus flavefaciens TaxID=1265 RepID=UPI000464C878|nr:CAP domain-containing protein [Ruminococcus flavefaciens]